MKLTKLQMQFMRQCGEFERHPPRRIGCVALIEERSERKRYYAVRDSLVKQGLVYIEKKGSVGWSHTFSHGGKTYFPATWRFTPAGKLIHELLKTIALLKANGDSLFDKVERLLVNT